MPRTNRNTVEFVVDGINYRATFFHQHGDIRDQGKFNLLKLQHITTCTVDFGESTFISGIARCSKKDIYSPERGIHKAFENCLRGFGINFHYEAHQVRKHGVLQFKPVKREHEKFTRMIPETRDHIVFNSPEDRLRYGKFMSAFYTEKRNRTLGSTIRGQQENQNNAEANQKVA